jgi:hypothetical protein
MKQRLFSLIVLSFCLSLSACSSPTEREFKNTAKLAEQGQVNAQFRLSQMYFKGVGTETNYQQGLIWIKKAAIKATLKPLNGFILRHFMVIKKQINFLVI